MSYKSPILKAWVVRQERAALVPSSGQTATPDRSRQDWSVCTRQMDKHLNWHCAQLHDAMRSLWPDPMHDVAKRLATHLYKHWLEQQSGPMIKNVEQDLVPEWTQEVRRWRLPRICTPLGFGAAQLRTHHITLETRLTDLHGARSELCASAPID